MERVSFDKLSKIENGDNYSINGKTGNNFKISLVTRVPSSWVGFPGPGRRVRFESFRTFRMSLMSYSRLQIMRQATKKINEAP